MPKPNVYMSDKDRKTMLSVIINYMSMWDDADEGMDNEEYNEIIRVRNKIKNMNKSQGYKNATIQNALDIANKVSTENSNKRKRLSFELSTCGACEHWQSRGEWKSYCPILKEETERDESCNDFKDLED
jgi:hypothetical protein